MSRVAGYEGNPEALLKESVSGLMTYLFGSKKNKLLRKEDFLRFQRDLINDLLWLEFCRYLRKDQSIFDKISEEDFCAHLLSTANITKKKKAAMVISLRPELYNIMVIEAFFILQSFIR